MISRRLAPTAVVILVLALGATVGQASGLNLGCEIITLDVAGVYGKVPAALGASSDALLAVLADQGMPPSELSTVEADLDAAAADVTTTLSTFPGFVPVLLLGAGIEIPLSLVVLDAVRVSGGILNTALVRGIAGLAGVVIPDPLLDQEFALGGETAHITGDLEVSVWTVSTQAVKRFDFLLGALNLFAGVDYTSCAAAVDIQREVPAGWEEGIDVALAALHLEDLRGSAFAAHVGARLEVGAPFLRVYVEAKLVQPIAEWVGWWGIRAGGLAGSVGVVIRF